MSNEITHGTDAGCCEVGAARESSAGLLGGLSAAFASFPQMIDATGYKASLPDAS